VSTARSTGVTPFNRFENALADLARAATLRFTARRGAAPA
jgi:hypothetical protein